MPLYSKTFYFLLITCLIAFSHVGHAKNLDVQLRLKRIFLFPGYDDVNGSIIRFLDSATEKYLSANSRFEVIKDASVVKALGANSAAYPRVAQNIAVHREAAQLTKADATVLVHSRRVGQQIEISQQWRTADGELLFEETKNMPSGSSLTSQESMTQNITQANINKIPFQGTITGRNENNTVTIDLNGSQVSRGQQVQIVRLVGEKRHPLLKTLLGADHVVVGTAQITSVDGILAFAKIIRENPTERINKDNKIIGLKNFANAANGTMPGSNRPDQRPRQFPFANENSLKNQEGSNLTTNAPKADPSREQSRSYYAAPERESNQQQAGRPAGQNPIDQQLKPEHAQEEKPKYGRATARVMWGQLSHSQTIDSTVEISGTGLGAALSGEVWVTKNWFGGFDFLYHSASLDGTRNSTTDIEPGNASWRNISLYGGYRFLVDNRFDGINIIGAIGYQSISMNLPTDSTNQLGPKTFNGLLFRVGGYYPLWDKHIFEGYADLVPFGAYDEEGFSGGDVDDSTSIGLYVGYIYAFKTNLQFSASIFYNTSTGNYKDSGSVTSTQWSIAPGVSYLF